MLSTLIYRSRLSPGVTLPGLYQLADKARVNNASLEITGILLFDGDYFLQILEGPLSAVNTLFEHICEDPRHYHIVQLMRDYASARRFGNLGMELLDLRDHAQETVMQTVLQHGTSKYQLSYDDRVLKFIETFVTGGGRDDRPANDDARQWHLVSEARFQTADDTPSDSAPCQFAFQPIVEPLKRTISSLEALIRSPSGGPAQDYFASLPPEKLYEADLQSKYWALKQAKKMGIGRNKISLNLLPMSLVVVPDAVDILLDQIARNGLIPDQVIVEVTEDEVISRFDEFERAMRQLRCSGISLAIDDFGAGFAGLSLLSRFQPDKLKIDRSLITDIHHDGPKQAIVQAIITCCSAMEIGIVAEGVEKIEEWRWLEAAGIQRFQGYLFARPKLGGIAPVAWPYRRES
ncbi:diguanylate phosphodiesterase [Erwinia tasmaniensis]|uniref:diguanylate phosphodiesterase n=1 Tax=Erwinia tasmaniensis TaxID=338565 RepID=UPI003A4DA0B2